MRGFGAGISALRSFDAVSATLYGYATNIEQPIAQHNQNGLRTLRNCHEAFGVKYIGCYKTRKSLARLCPL